MKRKILKLAAVMMAAFLMVTSITPAFAAMEKVTLNMRELGTYFSVYHNVPSFGKYTGRTTVFMIGGEYAFCIESGNAIRNADDDRWIPGSAPTFIADYNLDTIAKENSLQSKIAYLGFFIHEKNPKIWNNQEKRDWHYAMTQMMIWQTLPDTYTTANGMKDGVYKSYFTNQTTLKEYEDFKTRIQAKLDAWSKKPSFDAKTHNISAGKTLTLTDSNGVFEDYNTFTYTESGVTISHVKGSNQLTVSADKDCSEKTVDISESDMTSVDGEKYSRTPKINYVYQAPRSQDLAIYGYTEPIGLSMAFNVETVTGKIAIEKAKAPDAASNMACPEAGAEFQVYQKSAGSYDKATAEYKDMLITDAAGKAVTKDLPHGTYTVHQTKGAEGHKLIGDFDVTIATEEHHKTYTYKLTNQTMQSKVQIVKKDAETGKTIPLAGTAYELTNLTTEEKIEGTSEEGYFVTDKSGIITFPQSLYYGSYRLTEKNAPQGYLLSKPIEFTVDGTQKILTIEAKDTAQRGIIKVHKTGEILKHIEEADGIYTPIFEEEGMEGAVFEIRAAEDIITADGTVRAKKGEKVDIITTDVDGNAQTEALYLGKYEVQEATAPAGYVLDKNIYEIGLKYSGQEATVAAELSANNERQKVRITLKKLIEEDGLFEIFGEYVYKNIRFGLFASEKITAADGSAIPEDGMIETIGVKAAENIFIGEFEADIPFGKYYIRETTANEQYILDEDKYPVEFTYQGQETAVAEVDVNGGDAIENRLIRGEVTGHKTDDEGNPLEGAVFGLFKADEAELTEENALLTAQSNKEGCFYFSNIPYGHWLVKEIHAPEGYLVSDRVNRIEVSSDEEVVEITLSNIPKTGDAEHILVCLLVMGISATVTCWLRRKEKK